MITKYIISGTKTLYEKKCAEKMIKFSRVNISRYSAMRKTALLYKYEAS